MRRAGAILIASLTFLLLFVACAKEQYYQDGVYRAEFADFDNRGYKDYLQVTVKDNVVTHIDFNAVDKDGALKTDDEQYAENMEKVQDTYPEKYIADLINQYMETQKISEVDALAGATYSSDVFTALFTELEKKMFSGDTEIAIVENIPTI